MNNRFQQSGPNQVWKNSAVIWYEKIGSGERDVLNMTREYSAEFLVPGNKMGDLELGLQPLFLVLHARWWVKKASNFGAMVLQNINWKFQDISAYRSA